MKLEELSHLLREHGVLIVAVVVVTTPFIWGGVAWYYRERIETLKEQLALMQLKNQFLEARLREPPQFQSGGQAASPVSADATRGVPTAAGPVRYPTIANAKRLTKTEVRDLARFYGLFDDWKVNPHLRFLDGDIAYWHEQQQPEDSLKREFEARGLVLRRADRMGEKIETQGDLSHKAQQVRAQLPTR